MPYFLQQVLSRVLFEFYSSFIQGRSTGRQCSVRRWRSSAEAREPTPGKSRRDMRGPQARAMTAAAQTHVHLPRPWSFASRTACTHLRVHVPHTPPATGGTRLAEMALAGKTSNGAGTAGLTQGAQLLERLATAPAPQACPGGYGPPQS